MDDLTNDQYAAHTAEDQEALAASCSEQRPVPATATDALPDRSVADRLAGQIGAAAAASAQASCALLELIGDFDATGAIRFWPDMKSLAHWLAWTCSMTPGVAREHARVARALRSMPLVRDEFREGRISYSKVRELSRVVGVIDESRLLEMAANASAAQLARLISAFRSSDTSPMAQQARRRLTWVERDDGMINLIGRLTKEDAALITTALQAARDQIAAIPSPADAEPDAVTTGTGGSMVDALVELARRCLDETPEDQSGEDRTMVVVHVSANLLGEPVGTGNVPAGTSPEENICSIDGQGGIEPSTAQRIACDSTLLPAVIEGGEVLSLGRTRRLVSRAQRRALMIRDRMCVFPGCHQVRHLQAHHIVPWTSGGETDLQNLALLCRFHHTVVHEGGMRMEAVADTSKWCFRTPDGRPYDCPQPDRELASWLDHLHRQRKQRIAAVDSVEHPDATTLRPPWGGAPFDVHACLRAIYGLRRQERTPEAA